MSIKGRIVEHKEAVVVRSLLPYAGAFRSGAGFHIAPLLGALFASGATSKLFNITVTGGHDLTPAG